MILIIDIIIQKILKIYQNGFMKMKKNILVKQNKLLKKMLKEKKKDYIQITPLDKPVDKKRWLKFYFQQDLSAKHCKSIKEKKDKKSFDGLLKKLKKV